MSPHSNNLLFALKVPLYKTIALGLKLVTRLVPQPAPLLYCGRDSVLQLAQFIAAADSRKVLLVTDADILRLGLAQPLRAELQRQGIEVTLFSDITPDPLDRVIQAGIDVLQRSGCDAVIGFGGGSSLDAAKLIASLGRGRQSLQQAVGVLKIRRSGLPLYLVPTTAGTGSEVTIAAVMSDCRTRQKQVVVDPKLLPIAVALDPLLMQGLPASITAATGIDALTHAVEAYLSRNASAATDRLALMAVRLIFANLPRAYRDGSDLQAREAMAIASCYAGLAFSKAGLGYVHGISHQLGARYHVPHGLANALILPLVLEHCRHACQPRLQALAAAATAGYGRVKPNGTENRSTAQQNTGSSSATSFTTAVRQLLGELELPSTLQPLRREDIPQLARDALKESHYLHPVPVYMDFPQCCALIEKLLPRQAAAEGATP
ncbi:MAG: iron-containing alcohol dehydrogenase [Gammaproteobacteria bacterium]|uniref:iron-containing alcohol dehydrogenase n=1 Tax=Pseudomaricurvus alcaniphilus TaxID=1166482 RepID=UPI00140CF1CF|nr:iron-containing alcohol dehydrogenase [Pseudomaricurvus alcaniphilus]MBR9909460.1 iron-containing alcohol dehydrogenase [Gammaproteobacteria bacterium]NHN37135.1 iron-containing alcohol dehydrogenase [Pseudomaricurvus alcaniphilus]